jgi:hypothetical protein
LIDIGIRKRKDIIMDAKEHERMIMEYVTLYRQLGDVGIQIIKSFHESLKRGNKALGEFSDIKEFKENDDPINFRFLNFKICIELKICTSKRKGFIEWYLDHQDLYSRPMKTLVIKDSFDGNGNIKTSVGEEKEYRVGYPKTYFTEALMTFCQKVDETESFHN